MKHGRISLFGAIVVFLLASSVYGAPTTYLPATHRAYDFLERMEQRFIITNARLGTKPVTRARIASLLVEVGRRADELSRTDRDEYRVLLDEFAPDMPAGSGISPEDRGTVAHLPGFFDSLYRNRRNFYSSAGEGYSVFVDPITVRSAVLGSRDTDDRRVYLAGNGAVARGTVGDHIGFHLDVRDSQEWGSRYYPPQSVTTMPGRGFVAFKGDCADFDETTAELTWSSGPFTLLYGRGENIWGRGRQGTLAMSGYASPYEMFRLETMFWKLRYTFVAAEIEAYPSMAMYYYNTSTDSVTVPKRFTAHRLEIDLHERLTIGLNEAIMYGGRWDLAYLNPVMFLRGAEHTNGDHDNAAMGADFRLLLRRGYSLYGELFIDDLMTKRLGTDWYGNKLAWQYGLYAVEPFRLGGFDARVEYTRIQPWVYTHKYPINVYDHYGSTLGYWTGPNSDEISAELRKRFSRRFSVSILSYRIRHGANPSGSNIGGDIHDGFDEGEDSTHAKFLDGILEKRTGCGFDLSYEPLWHLVLKAGYTYEDENGAGNHIGRFSLGLNE